MLFPRRKKSVSAPGERVPVVTVEAQLRAEIARLQRERDELFAINQRQADVIDEYRGLRQAITVQNAD